ncbi:YdcF family protein [Actinoplanes sp. TRM 88003]|uniref:YdcF family protein n=1 Tax=Paractinoplanes aksuensis TaxID=2939490 RepID=A0ABT1DDZ3_9ACTN|nr:YdcF family protein [Actinoplanes aksuensis]MCO8269037.1 YdcF family protein [Actinoplanes aksuensis]
MVAEQVNVLVDFCAMRDVDVLSGGLADVVVLFGGSILAGGDVLARALEVGAAPRAVIVGGQGHSTDALRAAMRQRMGWDDVDGLSEASLFARYLRERHGLDVDRLGHGSTNCGSNVREALDLLEDLPHERVLIIQDATMQRRMDAGFRLLAPDMTVVNFAAHRTHVGDDPPPGMWAPERYRSMLMGEIPRLADGPEGYGPSGRGFIARVEVPDEVMRAYSALRATGAGVPRAADPRWADAGT